MVLEGCFFAFMLKILHIDITWLNSGLSISIICQNICMSVAFISVIASTLTKAQGASKYQDLPFSTPNLFCRRNLALRPSSPSRETLLASRQLARSETQALAQRFEDLWLTPRWRGLKAAYSANKERVTSGHISGTLRTYTACYLAFQDSSFSAI